MTPQHHRQIFFGLSLLVMSASVVSTQAPPRQVVTPDQISFFENKIRPVLASNCFSCHGAEKQFAGLRLDSIDAIKKGGDSGPAVVLGDPEKSLLIEVIRHTGDIKMPKGKKLPAPVIQDLEAWVKMRAPWPTGEKTRATKAPLWSLQPVGNPKLPTVKSKLWPKNGVDSFILAGIEQAKLVPAPAADKRTLIRRVTYDLTGLPPSADEVDQFLADKSPNAYTKLVDRLLASPRYGERKARQWLDVARYADTKGYVFEEDRNYPNAYTYRDWVISAFNSDLPYDQFILQQLAADRLPLVKDGDDNKPLAAIGFLTLGRRFLNNPHDIIDDRIDVTMRGFQGLTVACARCHDHKFDPIPTEDYYSLYGIFASSDEVLSPISERPIRDPWIRHNQKLTNATDARNSLIRMQVAKLRKNELGQKGEVKEILKVLREEQLPDEPKLQKLRKQFEPGELDRLIALENELRSLASTAPTKPEFAMAMVDKAKTFDTAILRRGDPGARGPIAPRRFLASLTTAGSERDHWTQGSGRFELAQSIADKKNPLTARVFVNRTWQSLFGAGLVRTPSDFGYQGEKPTHPELLDFLASSFMDAGWSIKKLHRLLVTSATYQQASGSNPKDPENRTWNRMNRKRLDLEQTRDSLVLAAGQLDLSKTGGKSSDLWAKPFSSRRAVYGFIERQNLPGTFRTFDFASPDATSARRFTTTVPQQALFFMNSPFAVEQARGVANRLEIKNSPQGGQQVRQLYRLLFGRLPDKEELSASLSYLGSDPLAVADAPVGVWRYGYGSAQRFTPLDHFSKAGYQASEAFPDPKLGYVRLTNQGGHPGNDEDHGVIRRWVAPAAMTVKVTGLLAHPSKEGDGVRARLVCRGKVIAEWTAHNQRVRADSDMFSVGKGEIVDFIIDPRTGNAFDSFAWAPMITSTLDGQSWSAATGFGPPPERGLTRITLLVQALMMTNEFLFVD